MDIGMAYKGVFKDFKNPKKYVGSIDNVVFRSLWERNVMKWLDENAAVEQWASEEIRFDYVCPVRNRNAKYYPDFYVKFIDGTRKIIEVKPKKQSVSPEVPKRKTQKYINEVATYAVNQEKWKAARQKCNESGLIFEVWTEDTLKDMGIMKDMYTSKPKVKPIKYAESNKSKMKPIRKRPKAKSPRPKRRS